MERYVIWYRLWLKAYWKKPSHWLQVSGMAALLLVLFGISLPDGRNVTVGICYGADVYAKRIAAELAEGDGVFSFRIYDREEELYRDVTAGKAECGFLFREGFDGKMESGDLEESITYICTPMTAKGEVARETLYAALLGIRSEGILKRGETEIYGNTVPERTQRLLEQNRFFLEGNQIFRVEMEDLEAAESGKTPKPPGTGEAAGTAESGARESGGLVYPIQGMFGIFLFLIMFLAYGRKFETGGYAVEKALAGMQRHIYGYTGCLAAGTLPAVAGILTLFFLGGAKGLDMVWEIVFLLLFLAVSGVWITAVCGFLRDGSAFLAGAVVITVGQLLVCPVFVDAGAYLPALKYVGSLFPVGIYLRLHGLLP